MTKLRGFLIANWLWLVPLALVLIIAGYYVFFGGSSSGPDKKEEQIESNIDQHQGEAGVIANQVTNQQQEVDDAATNTNEAIGNLHNSVNRDSSTFNGNGTNRFCERFPCDSTCDEWRKQRPEIICNR
jgi:hypothetical protein